MNTLPVANRPFVDPHVAFAGKSWRDRFGLNEPVEWYRETERDFSVHVDDFYEKTWKPDKFDWDHDVLGGLRSRLDSLSDKQVQRLARLNAPLSSISTEDAAFLAQVGTHGLPTDEPSQNRVKDLIAGRQFVGLKEISNHALTAEQAAVAPLSTGIITFQRHPRLQHAVTTFVQDEAKHSQVFERYLTEKLGGEMYITGSTIFSFNAFTKLAKVVPSAAVFLALAVETVGGSFFEFFAEHSPDPLFKDMCDTIANRDEKRHMGICGDLYNELFRKGTRWERFRNGMLMKAISSEIYGEQARPEHHLMQACQSFGIAPQKLLDYISQRVNEEFAKIGFDITPEHLTQQQRETLDEL